MRQFLISGLLIMGAVCFTGICQIPSAAHINESEHEQRRKDREEKTHEFCIFMDSLIRTNVYTFIPSSFQVEPAGRTNLIRNPNFRVDIKEDYIDVYLPYYTGFTPPYRRTIINNTLLDVDRYAAQQSEDGEEWTITFSSSMYSADTFTFKMEVYTCTGHATLTISSTQNNPVSYDGYLRKIY